jgi:hypothetical protein
MKIKSSNRSPSSLEPQRDLVIISRGTPDWDEWMEYFAHVGSPHSHQNSYARKVGRMTVAAKFPEIFDPAWRNREPVAVKQGEHPPKPNFMPSTGKPRDPWEVERQQNAVAKMLEALKSELGTFHRKGGARDRRDAEAEKRKAQEWLAEYQAGPPAPVPVSPKLAALLDDMAPRNYSQDVAE